MLTTLSILKYFFVFLMYLFVVYAIGRVLTKSNKIQANDSFTSICNPLFWGIISIVFTTSILYTQVLTVNTGLFLLLFVINRQGIVDWFLSIKTKDYKDLLIPKDALFILLTGSLFFLLNLTLYKTLNDTKLPHEDYLFYSQLVDNLHQGYEGLSRKIFEFDLINVQALTPYHYFELWTAVPVIPIIQNPVWALLLIAFPLLMTIAFMGLYTLISYFFDEKMTILFLSLLLFFIGGWQFEFMHTFLAKNYTGFITDSTLFSQFGKKYAILFISGYYALIQYQRNNFKHFILGLSLAAFFYPTVLPGIAAFIIYQTIINYKSGKEPWKILLVCLGISLYPLVFYFIGKVITNLSNETLWQATSSMVWKLNYGAGAWFILISVLSFGIYLLPLSMAFRELLGRYKMYLTFLSALMGIGFLISLVIPIQHDQIQFYSNTLPFLIILIQLSIIIGLHKNVKFVIFFLLVTSGFTFYKNYAKQLDFNRTVSEMTNPESRKKFDKLMMNHHRHAYYGYFWPEATIEKLNSHSHLLLSANFGYLKIHGYLNALNLTNLPDDQKHILYDEPFMVYAYQKEYEQSLKSFIKDKSINILLMPPEGILSDSTKNVIRLTSE